MAFWLLQSQALHVLSPMATFWLYHTAENPTQRNSLAQYFAFVIMIFDALFLFPITLSNGTWNGYYYWMYHSTYKRLLLPYFYPGYSIHMLFTNSTTRATILFTTQNNHFSHGCVEFVWICTHTIWQYTVIIFMLPYQQAPRDYFDRIIANGCYITSPPKSNETQTASLNIM